MNRWWVEAVLRVMVVLLCLGAGFARADCETYWMRFDQKSDPHRLPLTEGASLLTFARTRPSWAPERYDHGGRYLGPAERRLDWNPIPSLASLRRVGTLDGRRVYLATYAEDYRVLLSEDVNWVFCASLIQEGHDGIAFFGEPEIFRWKGRDILSIRYYIEGNGSLQESVFLARSDDGSVALLEQAPFPDEIRSRGWGFRSHGGGFCPGSLRWEQLADRTDPVRGAETAEISVHYRMEGRRLVVERVTYAVDEAIGRTPGCDIFYEMRRLVKRRHPLDSAPGRAP